MTYFHSEDIGWQNCGIFVVHLIFTQFFKKMVFWTIVYQFAHDIKYHIIKDSICYFIYLAMSTPPRCASQVCKLSGLTHDNAICKWVTRRRLTSWHLYQCGWKWIPSFKQIKNLSTFYFCFLIFKRAPLFIHKIYWVFKQRVPIFET